MRVVDKPADAVRVDQTGRSNRILLHLGCARDGGEIQVVGPMREVIDRVEVAGTGLRIRRGFEDKGVVAAAGYRMSPIANSDVFM